MADLNKIMILRRQVNHDMHDLVGVHECTYWLLIHLHLSRITHSRSSLETLTCGFGPTAASLTGPKGRAGSVVCCSTLGTPQPPPVAGVSTVGLYICVMRPLHFAVLAWNTPLSTKLDSCLCLFPRKLGLLRQSCAPKRGAAAHPGALHVHTQLPRHR